MLGHGTLKKSHLRVLEGTQRDSKSNKGKNKFVQDRTKDPSLLLVASSTLAMHPTISQATHVDKMHHCLSNTDRYENTTNPQHGENWTLDNV